MNITIILCTYNRCDYLKATLHSILSANINKHISVEILVVDNNSTDATVKVVNNCIDGTQIPIRYIFEKQQGLSFARNKGISESTGEILAFIDDDVLLDKEWITSIFTTFQDREVSCAGGKIYPLWQKPCPQWLKKELHSHLALLDLGDKKIKMTEPHLWGANLIFRASMFEKYGMFNTSLGRTAGKLYGNEEIVMIKKLIDNGEGVYYMPKIMVHHCIGSNRMQKSYFRKWFFDAGELDGIQMGYYPYRNLRGVPYYYLKNAFKTIRQCLASKIGRREDDFLRELSLVRTVGFIHGRMKAQKSIRVQLEANVR